MNGRLGAVDVAAANTAETVYTSAATRYSTVSVSVCNRGPDTTQVTLSGSAIDNTIDTTEIFEYRTELLPHNVLERTGIVVPAGEHLVVESTTTNVSVVVMGAEA